ncbi:MAG: iron complex outermembrane receptor protein [Cellvibrionaceae bacterium]|jgi:iron complex outermembrane receptor protein
MKIKKNIAFFLSSLLLLAEFSGAENDLFLDDLPIVISASRLNQSVLTSPTSVTVIDKAIIEASGFIEFVDLLRLVPGFQVAHVDGRRFAVAYHGLGSDIGNRLQVLVNGRSTFTPTLSTVDWDLLGIQLADIERIEVVRGSSASAYGSNSFTAAINIITKPPALDDTTYYHYRKGNKGEINQLLRFSDSTESINYRFTAAHRKNDGLDDYSDSRDYDSFSLHTEFNKNTHHPVDLHLNYTDGFTGTEISSSFLEPRDKDARSWAAHVKGQKILSQTQDIKWNIYHNDDETNDLSESFLLSDVIGIPPATFTAITGAPDQTIIDGDETNESSKTDMEATYNSITVAGQQYMLGSGIRYDTLRSKSYFSEKGKASEITYRIFGNSQADLSDHVTLNTGAIYEHTNNYKGRLSPRAGLNFRTNDSQSIRLSASRGYRIPSLLERNFDKNVFLSNNFLIDTLYISDDNIKPERIDSYDIAYLGQLRSLPITWDLKLYKDKITDTIGFPLDLSQNDPLGNHYRLISNNGDHEAYGIEGEISYRTRNDVLKFHFNYGRTKTRIEEEINPTELDEITSTAPNESYGLLASKKIDGWQFNFGIFYVAEAEWLNTGDRIEKYTRADASISKKFRVGKNIFEVKIATQNIGEKYKEFDNRRFFETRHYATLSYTIL